MGRFALLTPSCGGLCADREEKRVTCGNEINRWRGKKQEQLDSNDPNQRVLLEPTRRIGYRLAAHGAVQSTNDAESFPNDEQGDEGYDHGREQAHERNPKRPNCRGRVRFEGRARKFVALNVGDDDADEFDKSGADDYGNEEEASPHRVVDPTTTSGFRGEPVKPQEKRQEVSSGAEKHQPPDDVRPSLRAGSAFLQFPCHRTRSVVQRQFQMTAMRLNGRRSIPELAHLSRACPFFYGGASLSQSKVWTEQQRLAHVATHGALTNKPTVSAAPQTLATTLLSWIFCSCSRPVLALNSRRGSHKTYPLLKVDRPCRVSARTSHSDPSRKQGVHRNNHRTRHEFFAE